MFLVSTLENDDVVCFEIKLNENENWTTIEPVAKWIKQNKVGIS